MELKKFFIKYRAFTFIFIFIIILIFVLYFLNLFRTGSIIKASGTIEAIEVNVSSKISGTVIELPYREGDYVKKGDLIVRLDIPEIRAEFERAKAAEIAATARLKSAEDNFKRSEELFKNSIISDKQFNDAKSALEVAEAALKEARAVKEVILTQINNSEIRAPISGRIILKTVEVGELVNPGMKVAVIADLKKVNLKIYLLERDIGKIKLGDPVNVFVDSYPGRKFLGKIIYISPQAEFTPKNIQTREERVTQVFAVKIEIDNPDEKLKPGLPADAEIKL